MKIIIISVLLVIATGVGMFFAGQAFKKKKMEKELAPFKASYKKIIQEYQKCCNKKPPTPGTKCGDPCTKASDCPSSCQACSDGVCQKAIAPKCPWDNSIGWPKGQNCGAPSDKDYGKLVGNMCSYWGDKSHWPNGTSPWFKKFSDTKIGDVLGASSYDQICDSPSLDACTSAEVKAKGLQKLYQTSTLQSNC